jgi:hypothetical protein
MISKKLKAGGAMLALSTALMLGSSVSAYAQVPDEVNTQSTATSTEAGSGNQTGAGAGSEAAQSKVSSETTGGQTQESGNSEGSTGSEGRITGTADSGTADSDHADSGNGVLTPSGNLSLVDDVSDADAEKMDFMTVTSKDGHVFYIVIDHNAASQNVYFLNQVDESDLMALMSDQDKEALKTNKEESESADAEEVVKPTVRDTSEVSPDASKTSQKTETKKNAANSNMILAAVLGIIGLIVIAAYYFLKIKPGKGGSSIADDLEFYDDEEYEKDDDETEPEFEEEPGEAGTDPENKEKASKDAPEEGDHL